ncbi:response regulator [Nocardioides coralli]|uniref:response regulator n=1 Tax=Nocardioides coralli TaxID=2872154 RepID=UPI001CA4249E|nr:response regulator [Nocardioides coralli]QZY29500.1 response regulator [Nocardioides coralli]
MTTRRARVLVVEDEVAVAGIHQGFLLAHGGFDVVGLAHTGEDAVLAVQDLAPDLVLLDIHLPDLDGVEVLRRVRQLPGRPVDVIAVTAAQEAETVRAAMAGGVTAYLVKPFTMAALHERLDQYLRQRAVASSGERLDQRQIDRLMRAPESQPPARLPKGLAQETLDQVVAELTRVGEGSAVEVGEAIGLSRVSVRRYLEHLVDVGRAVRRPRYGTAGRPEIEYRMVQPAGQR